MKYKDNEYDIKEYKKGMFWEIYLLLGMIAGLIILGILYNFTLSADLELFLKVMGFAFVITSFTLGFIFLVNELRGLK